MRLDLNKFSHFRRRIKTGIHVIPFFDRAASLKMMLERASVYQFAGELSKAEQIYKDILDKDPNQVTALNNLGNILQSQGRLEESTNLFQKLILRHPTMAVAYDNLGRVLCEAGKLEESFVSFRKNAELTYDVSENNTDSLIHAHKVAHDQEQRLYIEALNSKISKGSFHIEGGNRVVGQALNVNGSTTDILKRWGDCSPRIIVIDDFLTQEALEGLRKFCLGSTIWRQYYSAGYLGAMPEHGMGSPLLAQIAEELRCRYQDIFVKHPLLHYWGFKYDSELSGTAVHADFAAINVNFWITPDEANMDHSHGGMIIWDTRAPIDWDFTKYNSDIASTRNFLTQMDAKATVIPYKSNRVVLFDSDLFHETDQFIFKKGYQNRRINITMLYGRRGHQS